MATTLQSVSLPMLDGNGRKIAELLLYPTKRGEESTESEESTLFLASEVTAADQGEQPIQLRERERYEYKIVETEYALLEEGGVSRSRSATNRGFIETGDFCGCMIVRLYRLE